MSDHTNGGLEAPSDNGGPTLVTPMMPIVCSPTVGQIGAALAKAQGVLEGALKEGFNPHFRSKYADLASVWDACREALSKNEIAVVQMPSAFGAAVTVTTLLLHSSGEWVQSSLTMEAADARPQTIGSAITYGRRYGLAAMVGVAPEDDDGNAAQGNPDQPEPSRRGRPHYRQGHAVPPELQKRAAERTAGAASPTPDRLGETPPAPAASPEGPKEEDRAFLKGAIGRAATAQKMTNEERVALATECLKGQSTDEAAIGDMKQLYLFLSDLQAVAQWREERKQKGAA